MDLHHARRIRFSLEITDRANRLVGEQLLTADMTTRQNHDRVTCIDRKQWTSKLDQKLNLTGGECLSSSGLA